MVYLNSNLDGFSTVLAGRQSGALDSDFVVKHGGLFHTLNWHIITFHFFCVNFLADLVHISEVDVSKRFYLLCFEVVFRLKQQHFATYYFVLLGFPPSASNHLLVVASCE